MDSSAQSQRNPDCTCYVGGLDEKVNEELLYELFLQAGPIVSIFMPRDKVTGNHPGYGFVEFRGEEDAEYALKILNMVQLYGKSIKVAKSSAENKVFSCGANVYIGNLASSVDEKLLYDTFSAFGGIVGQPGIVRDAETGESKGYGFISYDSFEASDLAIECMHNQFLSDRTLQVQYALKKDGNGERHGTQAERMLAAQTHVKFKPHTIFAGEVPMTAQAAARSASQQQLHHNTTGGFAYPHPHPAGVGVGMGMPAPMEWSMGGSSNGFNQQGYAPFAYNQYDFNQSAHAAFYPSQQYGMHDLSHAAYGGGGGGGAPLMHAFQHAPPPLPVNYASGTYSQTGAHIPPPPPPPPM